VTFVALGYRWRIWLFSIVANATDPREMALNECDRTGSPSGLRYALPCSRQNQDRRHLSAQATDHWSAMEGV
jgi:hypothetical protein